MKLFYSKASPFARKVRATSILVGLERQIDLVLADPWSDPAPLLAANPLGQVPTLVTEDGFALFDSSVICEYLDAVGNDLPLIPPAGAARWIALRLQKLGDGLMDALVMRRRMAMLAEPGSGQRLIDRQVAVSARVLDDLEAHAMNQHLDIGHITVGCALGFLDFRFRDEPWRESRPKLSAWYETIAREEFMRATAPE